MRAIEAIVLLVATLVFAIFCIAPLMSMQGNPALQADFGVESEDGPPPSWMLPFDDSYIFIRYAQQLHRGHPFQWNTGEASSGASSFLYPWILLPGQWFSDEIDGWSRWSRAVGIVSLWLLGLAAVFLTRTLGLTGPWPLAVGLTVVWSGPVGFGSLSGMESALNAAALLLALALWVRPAERTGPWTLTSLAVLISLLPLVRPENLLLTLIAAAAVLVWPGAPLPRWTAPLLILPGLGVALLNFALTGLAQPTAVVTKSWLGIAFPDLLTLVKLYLLGVWTEILPVYLGARGFLLWPPVGLVALIVAVAAVWGTWRSIVAKGGTTPLPTTRLTKLAPLAIIWWVLVALSPMSSMPTWQGMRHHHSGLVCAWVLAFAGTGLVVSKLTEQRSGLRRVSGALVWLPALLLMTFLPTWGGLYAEKAIEIHHRHGVASGWLQEHAGESVLLLNDAGILSLAHDGPAIDVMGLGTPEFARAYRHGAGSLVEMLARRDPLPTVSAANLDVFRLRDVLSTAVIEGLAEDQTIVAEVDLPLLENTALEPPGIDFAHLPSEAAASLRWSPAPDPYLASLALKLPGEDGVLQLQGCRPLIRRLEVGISSGTTAVQATFAPVGDGESQLSLGFVGSDERHAATLPAGRWTVLEIEAPGDTHQMWLEALPGSVTPCLESLGFR